MIKEIFFEAKTIPEAVEKAAATLGLDKDLMVYEVVTMPVKGVFGIGAVNAKIKIEQEVPDEKPAPAPKAAKPVEFVEKIAKKDAPKAEKKVSPKKDKAPKQQKIVVPEAKELEVLTGEVADAIREFLGGALTNMGLEDAQIEIGKGEESDTVEVRVSGSHMGVLIGRRGETLDAMQYLISLIVNRKFDGKTRVVLDTENYRAKRIAALTTLAEKTAAKCIKYKKNFGLEPMTPYERRIIHAALNGKDNITTVSVGSEPRRRIIVTYVK